MSHSLFLNPTAFEAGLMAALNAQTSDVSDRKSAFDVFIRTGLPHRRMEAWKWTDMRAALQLGESDTNVMPEAKIVRPSIFDNLGGFTVTIDEQGAHWGDQIPNGMTLRLTNEVPKLMSMIADHPMANLAAALCPQTLIITVSESARITAPLHIRRCASSAQSHMRVLVSLDQGASLSLIESLELGDDGEIFDNLLTEMRLGEGAHCQRVVYCDAGNSGVDMSLFAAKLQANAKFEQYAVMTGGKRARLETRLDYQGIDAQTRMFSAALLSGKRHGDLTSHIRHQAERCITDQSHKTVLKDQATGVFQGKFLVEREGQKTDANMQANAMLLSDRATINHKPELEIYADDVLCAHGSTSGALDEDAIFYLRQRGLNQETARSLLVEAFVGEIFDEIENEQIADIFRAKTIEWLALNNQNSEH